MKSTNEFYQSNPVVKALFGLCFATIVLITSAFVYASISFGWFSNNKDVKANGMSIKVQAPEIAEASVAFYDVSDAAGGSITFDLTKETDAILPTYDILDTKTHYILMEITAEATCYLNISTDTTYRLDSTKPLLGGDGKGDAYSNWISSIIFFEEVTLTNSTCTLNSRVSFIDRDGDYTFKNTADTPLIFTYAITADTPLYIVIGYDIDLMNKLYSENIGNSNINSDTDNIQYVNDCKFAITLGGDAS